MYEAVIAGAFTVAGIAMTKLFDFVKERTARKDAHRRLETEASGEWSRALLVDQATFRKDLLEQLEKHDKRCDEKIAIAIGKSERDCDDKLNRKLRSQAAQLRAEFEKRLQETSEASDD